MTEPVSNRKRPEITPDGIKIDDVVMPLLSGEIHYWRISPQKWRPALECLKLSGANTVATYVPWDQHEINEGYTSLTAPLTYDFTGVTNPANNLCGFLQIADGVGLKVMIRPGPTIIAEWRHKGPPLHSFAFDWPDEGYVSALRRWYQAVGPVIAHHAWQNGGPIILCQPDNEGHELTPAGFALFLADKFADVSQFNQRFGTDYATFSNAAADLCVLAPHNVLQKYVTGLDTDDAQLKELAGAAKEWFHARYLEAVHEELRAAGVDLPFVINVISSPGSTNFHRLHEHHDALGMDHYPPDHIRGGAWYMSEYCANYFAHVSHYPFMAEFGTSSFLRQWCMKNGPVRPQHLERIGLLYWANGIKGFNYYMFMDRDQCFGAPLDADARPTENYFALLHLHRVIARPRFNLTKKIEKVAILWVREWLRDKTIGQLNPDRDWLEFESYTESYIDHPAFRKIHAALVDADASFAILELAELAQYEHQQYDLLLLPCGPPLPELSHKFLESLNENDRARIRVVAADDGCDDGTDSRYGFSKSELSGLLAENQQLFFPARLRTPGIRSFMHESEFGRILFIFNRTAEKISVELPDYSCRTVVNIANLAVLPHEKPVTVPAHGQLVLLLTDSPQSVIKDRMVLAQYE